MTIDLGSFTRRDSDKTVIRGSFADYMRVREFHFLNQIIQNLFPKEIPRYLDFACGAGQILAHLENKAQASYGMDLRQSMIGSAKLKCQKSEFLIGDITRDEWSEVDPFQLITCFRFFGKARDELRSTIFAKLNKYLVDGGYLIFNNHRNPWSAISIYKRHFGNFLDSSADLSYLKIRKHLKQAKFKIIRIYGIGGWLLTPNLNKHTICNSKLVWSLEPLSRIPFVAPFCPDIVVVAQKQNSISA